MKPSLRKKLKKLVKDYLQKEASTTGNVAGVLTPFAFSKRGARPDTLKQAGYSLTNVAKHDDGIDENQMYSEPSYATPAQNIEPVQTFIDKNGLVQHNDPEIDPNLVGFKQGQLPMKEISYKKLYEGIYSLTSEQEETPQQPAQPAQPALANDTPQKAAPQINVQSYSPQIDYMDFNDKLTKSTESLKIRLQQTIQDKTLGKKVVIRASKGYNQPEMDYTVNVTGVAIDYYYDKYVIIIIAREENKQKTSKFFLKPGFTIRILGNAENLKPKDQYQIAKSQALVKDQPEDTSKSVTSDDDEDNTPPEKAPEKAPAIEKPLSETHGSINYIKSWGKINETFERHLNLINNK